MSSGVSTVGDEDSNPNYKWLVLSVALLGSFMATLDSSIVNVSLPAIMADFGASIDDIEWVITAYMLAFASLIPLTGWLRDRIGNKVLFVGSLSVFTIGSLLCGLSWNLPSLIAARVIQAVGGGAINPTTMAMISDVFEPRERAKALSYWGLGVIVGPALGPTLGGYLTYHISWRAIFMVNLPIGVIAVIASLFILHKDKMLHETRRAFDLFGFLFLATFLVAFLLGLSKGDHEGWTSTYIITCFLIAIVAAIGFFTVETAVVHPILDLTLFRSRGYLAAILVTAGRAIGLYGGTFLLPLFMQNFMGLDEIQSGLVLLPGALVIGIMMPIAPRLSERIGTRTISVFGLFGIAWFMFIYRHLTVDTSIWGVVYPTLIRGVGVGLIVAPVMAVALNSVPKNKTGQASVMLNLIQQVAGSIGIAILGTTLSIRTKFHLSRMGAVDLGLPNVKQALEDLYYKAFQLGHSSIEAGQYAKAMLIKHVSEMATVSGFQDAFLVGAILVLFSIGFAFLLPQHTTGGSMEEPAILE
jgi:DHA2 family multidrug resistance protein